MQPDINPESTTETTPKEQDTESTTNYDYGWNRLMGWCDRNQPASQIGMFFAAILAIVALIFVCFPEPNPSIVVRGQFRSTRSVTVSVPLRAEPRAKSVLHRQQYDKLAKEQAARVVVVQTKPGYGAELFTAETARALKSVAEAREDNITADLESILLMIKISAAQGKSKERIVRKRSSRWQSADRLLKAIQERGFKASYQVERYPHNGNVYYIYDIYW